MTAGYLNNSTGCVVTPEDPTAEELASEARTEYLAAKSRMVAMCEKLVSNVMVCDERDDEDWSGVEKAACDAHDAAIIAEAKWKEWRRCL